MKALLYIALLTLPMLSSAQLYDDYLGAGHDEGVTITSSGSTNDSPAANTFSGKGMDSPTFAAGRFLNQACLGHDMTMVETLVEGGNDFEGWIDEQFTIPATMTKPLMHSIWDEIVAYAISNGGSEDDLFGPYSLHFQYAWTQNIMTNEDHLRHRVAQALSQILVVSDNSDLGDWGDGISGYYDILVEHSFGNYRDLLEDVTYSFQMGYYLSHLNNAKENAEANTSPDENYAREIMQLFTIGLYQLNMDGTPALDANGDRIPTYDQEDIQQFATVFTGLGIGTLMYPNDWPYTPFFGLDTWAAQKDAPMIMYPAFHETAEKTLLNGTILPANQTGNEDISDAIDNLFNHPSTAPFISNLLIKRLVKSNPTPGYIERVATAFADNGSGVRGDMKAVIKAILLDDEARTGEAMLALDAGRIKEPLIKYVSYVKAMPTTSNDDRYWFVMRDFRNNTGQSILGSPTVFNFYLPDFQPIGDITDNNMTAPELKLHNTSTAISWINDSYARSFWDDCDWDPVTQECTYVGPPALLYDWEDIELSDNVRIDIDQFLPYATQPELFINEMDKRLCFGQMSDHTRGIITDALTNLQWNDNDEWMYYRIKNMLYYVLISPDFNAMR